MDRRLPGISSNIPRKVKDLLIDIKYVSGLPPGCKYDIDSRNYVDAYGLLSRGYRTYRNFFTNEGRIKVFDFVEKTIDHAVEIAKEYQTWAEVICDEIVSMKNAMTNLKHVYEKHPDAKARIETIELRISSEAFNNACQE